MKPLSLVALVLLLSGCTTGPELSEFKPAHGPQGAVMEIKLEGKPIRGNDVSGELLATNADGVFLNVPSYPARPDAPRTVLMVPYRMMKFASIDQVGRIKVDSRDEERNQLYKERLRLLSRFPQGLSDPLLDGLLAYAGQAEVLIPFREGWEE